MPLVPMTPAETSKMIDEVRSHGFDPAVVRCCVPSAGLPGSVKGVLGCNVCDRCEFHLTRMGGFRNRTWRPKNIAVYTKPDHFSPIQNVIMLSCFDYVRLMRNRQRDGARDIDEHGAGEVIQVIAQEGEPYTQIVYIKANKLDPNTTFIEDSVTQPVPEYRHPGQMAGTSAQRAMGEAMKGLVVNHEPTGPPVDADWADDEKVAADE